MYVFYTWLPMTEMCGETTFHWLAPSEAQLSQIQQTLHWSSAVIALYFTAWCKIFQSGASQSIWQLIQKWDQTFYYSPILNTHKWRLYKNQRSLEIILYTATGKRAMVVSAVSGGDCSLKGRENMSPCNTPSCRTEPGAHKLGRQLHAHWSTVVDGRNSHNPCPVLLQWPMCNTNV